MNERLKILGAEDSISQRLALQAFIEAQGYQFIPAANGREACEKFIVEEPDLLILDIEMPVMDGIEAARRIKMESGDRYIPIIFLTQIDPETILQQCLLVGGDDFVSKPIKPTLLYAKISALLRVQQLYQAQRRQNRELIRYQQLQSEEQSNAAQFQQSVIRSRFFEAPCLRYSVSSMALFSGDFILSAKSPEGALYVLVGDFTGHGLSASLGASYAAEVFYSMTEKGHDPTEIVSEINNKLTGVLPRHLFLAATLLLYDPDSLTIRLITCGLPAHLWLRRKTGEIGWIQSLNIPLGIETDIAFSKQIIHADKDDVLLLFTDGLIEARDVDGAMFGQEALELCVKQNLNSPAPHFFETIQQILNWHTRGAEQQDDITLLQLMIGAEVTTSARKVRMHRFDSSSLPWRLQLQCSAPMLKSHNPVARLVGYVVDLQSLQPFRHDIYLIVSELFNNALDHGLLRLDSRLKETPEGFQTYYQLRQQRLEQLTEGQITVSFDHKPEPDGGCLSILVEDSGNGFEQAYDSVDLTENAKLFGRGLKLVESLSQRLTICGGWVQAVYRWRQDKILKGA